MSNLVIKLVLATDRIRSNVGEEVLMDSLMKLSKGDFGLLVNGRDRQSKNLELGKTDGVVFRGLYEDSSWNKYSIDFKDGVATIKYENER